MKPPLKLLPFGLLLLLPSCLNWFWEKPTFTPKEMAITRVSLTEAHFLFGIEVQNPNRFDIKLRGLDYKVYLNEQEVGRGRLEEEVRIGKSASTMVQVPLQADFKSLGNPIGFVLSGKELRYKIEGAAVVTASLGTVTFPFSKSGDIKLKNR